MKKQKNTLIILVSLVLIITLFGFIAYNSYFSKKVELAVKNIEFNPTFKLSLSKGCITHVNGTISNIGEKIAVNIIINCKIIGSGGGDISGIKNIGFLNKGESSNFKMVINNDCPAPIDVECSVNCGNCKYIFYG